MKKLLLSASVLLALTGGVAAQTATLAWVNTTTRTNGAAVTGALTFQVWDLSGNPAFNRQISPGVVITASPFKTPQLDAGAHTFTVVECEAGGACSAPSNAASATVVPVAPNAITTLTVTIGP